MVVEGYFDLIALHRAGVEEALATCGTALTAEHARELRRRTQEVVLFFDGDEAGQRAMERALEVLLPDGLRVRAAALAGRRGSRQLPAQRAGAEALRQLVDQSAPALDRVIERAVARGLRTPWEKADAVAAVAPLLALIRRRWSAARSCARSRFAVGIDAHHVEAAVRAVAARRGSARGRADRAAPQRARGAQPAPARAQPGRASAARRAHLARGARGAGGGGTRARNHRSARGRCGRGARASTSKRSPSGSPARRARCSGASPPRKPWTRVRPRRPWWRRSTGCASAAAPNRSVRSRARCMNRMPTRLRCWAKSSASSRRSDCSRSTEATP